MDFSQPRSHFVKRQQGRSIQQAHTAQHRPFLKRSMFWGCFSYHGPGPLCLIAGMMNGAKYIDTLRTHLLPQMNEWFVHGNGVFQQDNAPCHKAANVMAMLEHEGIQILD